MVNLAAEKLKLPRRLRVNDISKVINEAARFELLNLFGVNQSRADSNNRQRKNRNRS